MRKRFILISILLFIINPIFSLIYLIIKYRKLSKEMERKQNQE